MAKKRAKKRAKESNAVESNFENMLHGLTHYADLEWQEWSDAVTPESLNPKAAFISAYLFGAALGMALSPRKPDLVQKFVTHFRENRGWDV